MDLPAPPTKMWLGLRTIVQTKYALDHIVQIGRKLHGPSAATIFSGGMLVLLQHHTESFVHGRHGTGENDGAAPRTGIHHRESVLAGKSLDTGNGGGICA